MKARYALPGAVLLVALLLSGCGGTPTDDGSASPSDSPTAAASPDAEPTASPTTPSATAAPAVPIPTDCRAILTPAVLGQLDGTPLNDEAFGPSGTLEDGSLRCIWGDPGADTTSLVTEISAVSRGPALEMLNALADEDGFTCYTPDEGTRCEKTWQNEQYPVTDGRTLFWRDGILIDTSYSNLAPTGYTSAIVAYMFS